jgi:WD40 repeat protein
MDDDADMADDAAMPVDDADLTPEERAQRAADDARTSAMATEIRQVIEQDDSKQGFFECGEPVFCSVVSKHNPTLVLAGSGDNNAFLWDSVNGEKKASLSGHTDSVIDGGFSSDGRLVATASMDATVRVYNVADGSLRHSLEGPAKELEWLAWHPAGPIIATGSLDETVWMFNADSGVCMSVFSGHSGGVTCGAWTIDGKQLITCDESGGVIVWSPKTGGAELHLKDVHDGAITSFAMHPDPTQKLCITGGHDGVVKVINYETGKTLHHFKQLHTDSVEGVQFAPLATKLKLAASCSVDGKVKILSVSMQLQRADCSWIFPVARCSSAVSSCCLLSVTSPTVKSASPAPTTTP